MQKNQKRALVLFGGDRFQRAFNDTFIMEIDKSIESKYVLVDWNRPHGHERLSPKPITMTNNEAHKLNRALLINRQSKRYIKSEV